MFLLLGIVITITGTQILELAAIAAATIALVWWIESGSQLMVETIDRLKDSNDEDIIFDTHNKTEH